MPLTQESVLCFLLEHGGKVKNSELLNHFRGAIGCSDPAEKQYNRELFKKLVNSVAVVKQIDEVKFVVVKKRYQDFARDSPRDVAHSKTRVCDDPSSGNSSFSFASFVSDVENNNNNSSSSSNLCGPSQANGECCGDSRRESTQKRRMSSRNDATTVKVLNIISGDQASRAGESGAVFALIAVKSPPRDPHQGPHLRKTSDKQGGRISARASLPSNPSACIKGALRESQSLKARQRADSQPTTIPQVRPHTKSAKPTDEHAHDAKYCESVPLEPLAHEWLVKCAAGLWGQIYALLLRDARLAQKKDFMSGFTALHWAAKDGNGEMIHKLVDVSRRRGIRVDINSKAHGGYTPLHIAAIHGHTAVMVMLVRSYKANVNERDHDGKKALHYLGTQGSAEVRALMGGVQQKEKAEEEDCKEQAKSFNTISKLFQPHMGKKHKAKFAHDW
ncbi:unnamed protein product [Ophioblennius macclurei]